ncbi:TIM barrel protein [bacterium]|nr:TIM barrel protein [bacterium]
MKEEGEKNQHDRGGISRRRFMGSAAGVAAMGILPAAGYMAGNPQDTVEEEKSIQKGRIQQSVCRWCYGRFGIEELAAHAARIGLKGIDLVDQADWPVLKKYGLICTMAWGNTTRTGINRRENHEEVIATIQSAIEQTAEAGFPNVIVMSGNRGEDLDDDVGLQNCAVALKQLVPFAEEKKIMLCMELLNSKVNHPGYMCDRTHWGVELVQQVGSLWFKLLYDIYHMQVQEGDIIATIRENKDYIAHYHTAGVPGRHEIDETQELYYPAIVRAIIESGFQGYLAHEFTPTSDDPLNSLTEAVRICDV